MYNNKPGGILLFLSLLSTGFLNPCIGFAQSLGPHENAGYIYEKAQDVYGPDDFIERGMIYIPQHPKAKGYPYFTQNDWNSSRLTLLGNTFDNYEIKYNVCLDVLILKKPQQGTQVHQPVLLQNSMIDKFIIGEFTFTNLQKLDTTGQLSGFGQLIYSGGFLFYRTFHKDFVNQYTQTNPDGFYTKLNTGYYIFNNGKVTKIIGKKSLLNYFEPIKKPLKRYIRNDHFRFKKATISEFNQLLKICESLLSDISG